MLNLLSYDSSLDLKKKGSLLVLCLWFIVEYVFLCHCDTLLHIQRWFLVYSVEVLMLQDNDFRFRGTYLDGQKKSHTQIITNVP